MSDEKNAAPTPETDAFYREHPICEYEEQAHHEDCDAWLEFARKLERERDEARRNYRFMVERAANEKLDGYRELAAAALNNLQRAEKAEAALAERDAEIARLREDAIPESVLRFACAVLLETRENSCGDLDGGYLQDCAESVGLLKAVPVAEECDQGECVCAEYGFPTNCYRYTDDALKMIRMVSAIDAPRKEGE